MRTTRSVQWIFFIDFILVFLSLFGLYQLTQKATLPLNIEERNSSLLDVFHSNSSQLPSLIVLPNGTEVHSDILPYDTIVALNGHPVHRMIEIELLCDFKRINTEVQLHIKRNKGEKDVRLSLKGFYSLPYIITAVSVTLLFLFLGIFVLVRKPDEKSARLFHHTAIAAALIVSLSWGYIHSGSTEVGYLIRSLFFCTYTLLPISLFHFTFVFPHNKFNSGNKRWFFLLYPISLGIALWVIGEFIAFSADSSPSNMHRFILSFNVCRSFVVLGLLASIISFIHSYRTAVGQYERRSLRLVLFGIVVAPLAFIVWIIKPTFITEEFVLLASAIAPISFAIAIARHNLMEIDLLLRRSLVYAIIIGGILLLYSLILLGPASYLSEQLSIPLIIPLSVVTIGIAFLFEPLRLRLYRLVDRHIFHTTYNYRQSQQDITTKLSYVSDPSALAEIIVANITELLSPERVGFYIREESSDSFRLVAHREVHDCERIDHSQAVNEWRLNSYSPLAITAYVEPDVNIVAGSQKALQQLDICLMLPILRAQEELIGILTLGKRRSSARYSLEDIHLLTTLLAQIEPTLKRIDLQRQLFLEQIEAQRLGELSQMKSFFVSSVSHDLKTPLTSIKLFVDLLRSPERIESEEYQNHLDIIDGEVDRLTRLINNVLDITRIERGKQEYNKTLLDLNIVVSDVLDSMEYLLHLNKCRLHLSLEDEPVLVAGDADALSQAIVNLVSNAIKFSSHRRDIDVSLFLSQGMAGVSIRDYGPGIPEKEQKKIFKVFYRSEAEHLAQLEGVGIGLAIVQHVVEHHDGKVEVTNPPDGGSKFTLLFPSKVK